MDGGDPLAGRVVGEFVLIERIGRGAFGTVYRAQQPRLDRDVVVKVLHRRLRSSSTEVERFIREAKLASRVDHPYAAHVYAYGAEDDGLLWIAMELVRGTPLDEVLRTSGPIPLDRFVPFFDRLCEVVHTAHTHGVIHRDLKPANVMVLSRAGRLVPKLLDLGIAKLRVDIAADVGVEAETAPSRASPTASGDRVLVGSPAFIAPELWRDPHAADARSDLYALGVLAYHALTGRLPFDARDRVSLAHAHISDAIPSLGDQFAAAVDTVLARALAKRPEDRHASVLELAADLRAAAGFQLDAAALPQLDESLREAMIARAPQPIAEATASLETARTLDRALSAVAGVVTVVLRYVGNVALACHGRISQPPSPALATVFVKLRRGALDDCEWRALVGELVRPFATRSEVHPIPELVTAFDPSHPVVAGLAQLDELARVQYDPPSTPDQIRERFAHALSVLERCLRGLAFLADYILVVPRDGRCESWMGLRRPERSIVPGASAALPDGRAALVDARGTLVASLWPLIEVAPPAPGSADELFLFEGRGRHGARRVARPVAFERHDASGWEAIGTQILGVTDDDQPPAVEHAPYRGLATFSRDDAELFFGRERETEAFANRLRVQRLLAIVGPSGAGKSSFVQAGVIPALPDDWWTVTIRPGHAPIATLASRLSHEGIATSREHLEGASAALGVALRAKLGTCVLVIDQFEEVFTQCRDPAERERYADMLLAAVATDDRARIVLTLRDDFLVRTNEIAALRDRLAHGLHILTTPLPADLLRIVREPARRAGYEFDDDALPAEMVKAVARQPGALPLLSFTGSKLWELRDRHFRQLTRKAYTSLGGVGGALAQHAESTLVDLSDDDRALVRQVFRHLVTADGTRARLARRELAEILDNPRAEALVERLIGARLLTAHEGDAGEDEIEVTHEALLVAWPRLVAWQREDAESARLRDGLRAAARQWDVRKRPRGLLWRDDALAEYRLWRSRFPGELTAIEQAFAIASLAEATKGRRIRRVLAAIAFAAITIVAVVLYRMQHTAQERLAMLYEEQGRQLVVEGDPVRGLVYLREAAAEGAASFALSFTVSAGRRMMANQQLVLAGHSAGLWDAQWSPDGTRIVTASEDGTARIWDATTGRRLRDLEGHSAVLRTAQWSPDGTRVITASEDRTARVWDASNGTLLATLDGHEDAVWNATFSPDGRYVMTQGADNRLRVLDARSLELRHQQRAAATLQWAVFSPDGSVIAQTIAKRGTVICDAATGEVSIELPSGGETWSVAFSPDGRHVATGNADGSVAVWDRATGRSISRPAGHRSNVLNVVFSRDGRRLLTAGNDGVASLWDAVSGAPIISVTVHGGGLHTAELDPEGARILTTSNDGVGQLWNASTGALMASFMGHLGLLRQGWFSPDGRRVLTASVDGTARVWEPRDPSIRAAHDIEDPGFVVVLGELGSGGILAATEDVAVVWDPTHDKHVRIPARPRIVGANADGSLLATTDDQHRLVLIDAATGTTRATLTGHSSTITRAAFGGNVVVTASRDRTARIWELSTHAQVAVMPHPAMIEWVETSSDGTLVVTAAADGHARTWTIAGKPIAVSPFVDHSALNAARFDRSGRRVVTAGLDGNARIWDLRRNAFVATLRGHQNFLFTVAFSPDGRLVASSSFDRTVKLWDAGSGKLLASLDAGMVASLELHADRLVTGGLRGRVAIWDVSVTPGTLDTLDAWLACRVPLAIERGVLASRALRSCP